MMICKNIKVQKRFHEETSQSKSVFIFEMEKKLKQKKRSTETYIKQAIYNDG